MKRAGPSEAQIQAAIVVAIRRLCPGVFVTHIPNGGSRHRIEAARLKAQGVSRGVPDLMVILPGSAEYSGEVCFIEVKKPGGSLTKEQRVFRDFCDANGIGWTLARSVEDALGFLSDMGADVRGRVQ